MTEFHCLDPPEIDRFLERRRAPTTFALELSLTENLQAILRKANEFVPSTAGAILLDEPKRKRTEDLESRHLAFIATFGEQSGGLLGQTVLADSAVAGRAYLTGRSLLESDVSAWPTDRRGDRSSRAVIAVPIRIETEVCGVLELERSANVESYSPHDLNLLEIFGDYISVSIQNVLDGRQAQRIAKLDELSGLYNDRYMHLAVTEAIADCRESGQDLTMLFVDLDLFKRINDTHGHLAGSQVLREVGQLLRETTAGREVLVARYGGDEFVLALPGSGVSAGIELAESIRTRLLNTTLCAAPSEILPEPLELTGVTCSIGVASLDRHANEEMDPDAAKNLLLRLSDAAMYVAKETGRDRTAVAGEPIRRQ